MSILKDILVKANPSIIMQYTLKFLMSSHKPYMKSQSIVVTTYDTIKSKHVSIF